MRFGWKSKNNLISLLDKRKIIIDTDNGDDIDDLITLYFALENKNIETEVYDFAHYPELKQKYKIVILNYSCKLINILIQKQ